MQILSAVSRVGSASTIFCLFCKAFDLGKRLPLQQVYNNVQHYLYANIVHSAVILIMICVLCKTNMNAIYIPK